MPNNCPDCGATVEFNAATARVLHGDCSGCGHAFTILEGLPAIPDARIAATGAAEESSAPAGPACSSCGESMVIRAASDTTLDAVCSGCGSHFSYSLATAPVERGAPRRPRRFEPITEERGGFDRERPPSRPCRECGGALQFSTGPDGMVTGECAQCGNRFTFSLGAREENGGEADPHSGVRVQAASGPGSVEAVVGIPVEGIEEVPPVLVAAHTADVRRGTTTMTVRIAVVDALDASEVGSFRPTLRCRRSGSSRELAGDFGENPEVPMHVLGRVLDGDRPLFVGPGP